MWYLAEDEPLYASKLLNLTCHCPLVHELFEKLTETKELQSSFQKGRHSTFGNVRIGPVFRIKIAMGILTARGKG